MPTIFRGHTCMDNLDNQLAKDPFGTTRPASMPHAGTYGKDPLEIFANLSLQADACRENYRTAVPWRHIVLDGLIDPTVVSAAETQELEPALNLRVPRTHRMVKAESPQPNGPAANRILDALCSTAFVSFLEDLTGVTELTVDPARYARGLYVFLSGGFQSIHRDFRLHPTTGMFHRLAVLVYLNSDWQSDYGGELELWRSDMTACERRIAPAAGRVVIFEPTPTAIHGIPDPIRCPNGTAHLSLTCSYYTVSPGSEDRKETRFLRPKRPQDPWYLGFLTLREGVDAVRRRIERPRATVTKALPIDR